MLEKLVIKLFIIFILIAFWGCNRAKITYFDSDEISATLLLNATKIAVGQPLKLIIKNDYDGYTAFV